MCIHKFTFVGLVMARYLDSDGLVESEKGKIFEELRFESSF